MPSHHSQKRPRGVASGSWDLDTAAPPTEEQGDLGAALEAESRTVGLALGTPRDFDRRFEVCDVIGRGAFSVVSRVVERASGRRLAVKTLDARPLRLRPNFSPKRLLREACILSRLRHPNVVAYVGVWAGGDSLRLVMEEAAGRELFDVILEKQAIEEPRAKPILRQLTGALAYLPRAQDRARRDVKPLENVLVVSSDEPCPAPPRVTLIDFGLSKALLEEGDEEAFPLARDVGGKDFRGHAVLSRPGDRGHPPGRRRRASILWSGGGRLVARSRRQRHSGSEVSRVRALVGQVARQGRHGGVPRRLARSAGPRRATHGAESRGTIDHKRRVGPPVVVR